jgi:hypothetical protein
MYKTQESIWAILIDGQERWLSDLSIELDTPTLNGTLKCAIASETERAVLELQLFEEEADDERIPNYRDSSCRTKRLCRFAAAEQEAAKTLLRSFTRILQFSGSRMGLRLRAINT